MEEGFGGAFGALFATVRARQGRLSGLIVLHSKSVLCGAFVWARRALNSQKRGFSARAVGGSVVQYGVPAAEGDEGEVRF